MHTLQASTGNIINSSPVLKTSQAVWGGCKAALLFGPHQHMEGRLASRNEIASLARKDFS